jgi:hypothetical protein
MRGTWIVIALALTAAGAACKKSDSKGGWGQSAGGGGEGDKVKPGDNAGKPDVTNPVSTAGSLDRLAFGKALAFDKLADRVLARPEVDKSFDALVEAVFADPQLAAFGSDLAGKLGADPAIGQGVEAITAKIGEDPNLINRIRKLIADKPGINEAEITAIFMEEFNNAYQLTLAKPIELAIQRTLSSLDIDKEADMLIAQLSLKLESSFTAYIEEPARLEKWTKRLTELNDGEMPSTTRAAELFLEHALAENRLAKYMVTVLADPATRAEVARFLLIVGKAKPVEDAIMQASREVATSREVQRTAIAALASAFDPKSTPGEATKRVDALFATDAFRNGLNTVVKAFLTEPSVPAAIDDSLRKLWATPSIKTATDQLLDGW